MATPCEYNVSRGQASFGVWIPTPRGKNSSITWVILSFATVGEEHERRVMRAMRQDRIIGAIAHSECLVGHRELFEQKIQTLRMKAARYVHRMRWLALVLQHTSQRLHFSSVNVLSRTIGSRGWHRFEQFFQAFRQPPLALSCLRGRSFAESVTDSSPFRVARLQRCTATSHKTQDAASDG